ncbi:MAG TPA: hypothetical protein PK990_02730 [Salinivirgaceae bacterium]|nr:hypothetical protein [Salinivirgaceae bacterium]
MKLFLKNLGLIILFLGVGIVAYTSMGTVTGNTNLIIGAVLIVTGLILYIIINRHID